MQAPNRDGSSDREKELERRAESLQQQLERALAEIERLRKQLEEALRANKRSAAPFSKGEPKSNPKRPGRKPGSAYGQRATRPVPSRVDEQIYVPLPPCCSHCHGPVILKNSQSQYQEDIVRMTIIRRFDVEVGGCRNGAPGLRAQADGPRTVRTPGRGRSSSLKAQPFFQTQPCVFTWPKYLRHASVSDALASRI